MAGVFSGAFWLAKRELRRAWTSYPFTGVLLMLMGFYVVPSVPGVFEFDGPGTAGEDGRVLQRLLLRLPVRRGVSVPRGDYCLRGERAR